MGMAKNGSSPVARKSQRVRYMPRARNSPWAKLITRMTPKTRLRPMPTMA